MDSEISVLATILGRNIKNISMTILFLNLIVIC